MRCTSGRSPKPPLRWWLVRQSRLRRSRSAACSRSCRHGARRVRPRPSPCERSSDLAVSLYMPQFGVGGESETVLLGCLVKEHLRLWRSDGRGESVRPLHPSALRAFVARGLAPRASLEPGRYREFGRLDGAGVLVIGNRPFAVEIGTDPEV